MKKKQTFVKLLLFAMLIGAPLIASAQVEINEANFPDEGFRNWLFDQDYGADGVLTESEIKEITRISVISQNISNLKGIEYFIALTWLNCHENKLKELNVSMNTALQTLYCGSNQLTALDMSQNTALQTLDCSNNQLTALDASKNIVLTELYCNTNQLTALDVANNTLLTYLSCGYNQLTVLDTSNNTELIGLYCNYNQLTTLNVLKNTELMILQCSNNQLTMLDAPKSTELTILECNNNQLTALDVSGCTALECLECYNNHIKGVSMDALISSLPQTDSGWFYVYDNKDSDEGNVCTKAQVAAAKAKGWSMYDSNGTEYEGSSDEETSIALPTTETVEANAPVYTLSGQKVNGGSLKGKKGIYIVGGKKVVVK